LLQSEGLPAEELSELHAEQRDLNAQMHEQLNDAIVDFFNLVLGMGEVIHSHYDLVAPALIRVFVVSRTAPNFGMFFPNILQINFTSSQSMIRVCILAPFLGLAIHGALCDLCRCATEVERSGAPAFIVSCIAKPLRSYV
jgi:hypothetical protein